MGDGVWVTVGSVALAAPARADSRAGRCGGLVAVLRPESLALVDDDAQPAWEGTVAGGGSRADIRSIRCGSRAVRSWRSWGTASARPRARRCACDSPDSRSPRCAHDAFAAAPAPIGRLGHGDGRVRAARAAAVERRLPERGDHRRQLRARPRRLARFRGQSGRPRRAVGDGRRVDRIGDRLAADRRAARLPALAHGVPRPPHPERRGHAARGAASARRRARVPVSLRRERRRHARRAARARARGRAVVTVGTSGRHLRARVHDVRVRLSLRERGPRADRHDARRGRGGTRRLAHAPRCDASRCRCSRRRSPARCCSSS